IQSSFSKTEIKAYKTKNSEQRLDFFYELWTLKESYVKALGEGMSYPLAGFSMKILGEKAFIEVTNGMVASWCFKKYNLFGQYKAAVCAKHCQFPSQPKIISFENLVELI